MCYRTSCTKPAWPIELLALLASLGSGLQAHGALLRGRPLVVFACHHKSGTDLLEMLTTTRGFKQVFGEAMGMKWDHATGSVGWIGHSIFQPHFLDQGSNFNASDARMYTNFDLQALEHVRGSGRDFRLVHLVRDPLALTVSGYYHHLKFDDTPRLTGTGPGVLRSLPAREGLEAEAAAELNGTVREAYDVLHATKKDPRVLTVGFEDFRDDFNATVACICSFLLGPGHPDVAKLLDAAQVANIAHWNSSKLENVDPGHFTTEEQKQEALQTIAADPSPVWSLVKLARHSSGYRERAPGVWRYKPPCRSGDA